MARPVLMMVLLFAHDVCALDVASFDAVVAAAPPPIAAATVDSLQRAGAIDSITARGLTARVWNRPGGWNSEGPSLDSLFRAARSGYHAVRAFTRSDSIMYATLLLDEAYFHARAAGDSVRSRHAEAEEACLRFVSDHAPLAWQRARAAMELGRMYRFHAPWYAMAWPDCTDAALRYLSGVALMPEAEEFRAPALWNLAWLEVERGEMGRARAAAAELGASFSGTKWEERAAAIVALTVRPELWIDGVASVGGSLVVSGTARNLPGTLRVAVARYDSAWIQRHARLPLTSERATVIPVYDAATSPRPAEAGTAWVVSLPLPPPGFYRVAVTMADTTVAGTLAVVDGTFSGEESDSTCLSYEGPGAVTVHAVAIAPGVSRHCTRRLEPGEVWCTDDGALFERVLVCDRQHAAWRGPRCAGPTWLVGR